MATQKHNRYGGNNVFAARRDWRTGAPYAVAVHPFGGIHLHNRRQDIR